MSHRKGGLEHEYWKNRVADSFRSNGYRIMEEFAIGKGQAVDLVASNRDKRIAIEIETGKSDAVHNIRKALAAGFQTVYSVALDEKTKEKIALKLHKIGFPGNANIRVITVHALVK